MPVRDALRSRARHRPSLRTAGDGSARSQARRGAPAETSRRALLLLAGRLVLGAVLERRQPTAVAVAAMNGWLRGGSAVPWLNPPGRQGTRTIRDVPLDADRPAHEAAVRAWAESVWASWSAEHATIRRWLDRGAPG